MKYNLSGYLETTVIAIRAVQKSESEIHQRVAQASGQERRYYAAHAETRSPRALYANK